MTARPDTGLLLEHLFRHQAGRMVARLTRLLGPAHVALAEETVQEAMVRALQSWPYQGAPDNPAGWLFRVAHTSPSTRSAALAVRGQLLLDLGRRTEAAEAFRSALTLAGTEPERRFLTRRLAACQSPA